MQLRQLGSNQSKVIYKNGTEVFFSYETPVAAYVPEIGYCKTEKKWSRTTSRHLNNFSTAYRQSFPQEYFYSLCEEV
jgi:hypothetical protein